MASPTATIFQRELAAEQQETVDEILGSLRRIQLRCRAAGREFSVVLMPNRTQVESAGALTTATMDPALPSPQLVKLCAPLLEREMTL